MKKLLPAVFIFSLLMISCDLFSNFRRNETGDFWAMNTNTRQQYRLNANLLVEGEHCTVWAERGTGISLATAQKIADEYDYVIRIKMIECFGMENFEYRNIVFSDTLAMADTLGDNDGKLCILLLDIIDSYERDVHDSYVAGYFYYIDLFDNYHNANRRDMIYIDTNPGMEVRPGSNIDIVLKDVYQTLSHEIQHLMNFTTSVALRRTGNFIHTMDLWIDEGLSAAAEYVCSQQHSQGRINWFVNNGKSERIRGVIDQGNNFFVWGNREGEGSGKSPYAILDDYATVYLFFQWLRLNGNGSSIYKNIISSQFYDYRAVTNALNEARPGYDFSNWGTLLEKWLAANYIQEEWEFGYNADIVLKNIRVPAPSAIATSVSLAPGEGVYSRIQSENPGIANGNHVKYSYLTDNINLSFPGNSVLLTYNSNTNDGAASENGTTTGDPILPIASNVIPMGRSAAASNYAPFPIGIRDLTGHPVLIPEKGNIFNE
ncbi:MAG: hypothetical protein FWC01_08470 [Treponema sp.]|nr:hypothetical protein [Treponema sp.]MCL2237962.1 hypothetical protein [Treponema sp.]